MGNHNCNSICVSLVGRVVSLVCLCTQVIYFENICITNPIAKVMIPIANAEVPMVENIFTFIEDQKLLGYVLSFVNMLFMLKVAFVSILAF